MPISEALRKSRPGFAAQAGKGRPKGARNKSTVNLDLAKQWLGTERDPAFVLEEIASNRKLGLGIRVAAARALIGYVRPQLKSVEVGYSPEAVESMALRMLEVFRAVVREAIAAGLDAAGADVLLLTRARVEARLLPVLSSGEAISAAVVDVAVEEDDDESEDELEGLDG